jgi:hypothetical protein
MRGQGRTRALRLTVFAALAALAGQSVLTHLHEVEESVSAVGRIIVADGDRSEALQGASTPAQEHDRSECPLCVARAQSRSPLPVPADSLVVPEVASDALASAAVAPPSRPIERALTLRGPPVSA